MSTLRWGFLGASRIGRGALVPAIRTAEGHELVAVAARDLERARAFATEAGMARAFGDYASLVDDPDIDCVYVALTNEAHLPWTLRALDAGKHVLCEKPMALDAAEVRSMMAAETRSGRRAMEAFCHVHHPQFAAAREAVASGALGRVAAIHASFTASMPDEDFRWQARMGGGALFDLGVYPVSLMRLLVAREPRRVQAIATMRGDVDATLLGTLDFGDGLLAQFACSFHGTRAQHFSVVGGKAQLRLDWPYSTKGRTTSLHVGESVRLFDPPVDPYRVMVEHFGQAVTLGTPMLHPLSASLAQSRVLDALFAAARSGGTVEVERDG